MESSFGRTNTYYSRPSGNHDAYEISIVGSPRSGKTTLIEAYCGKSVDKEMPYTYKHLSKNYSIQNLYLYDNDNENENVKHFNTDAIILTIDLTNRESYFYAMFYIGNFHDKNDLKNYNDRYSRDAKLIIALTKSDAKTEVKVTEDDICNLIKLIETKNIQYINALETSILKSKKIEKLFSFLINKLEETWGKKQEIHSPSFFHTNKTNIETNKLTIPDENQSLAYVLYIKKLIIDVDTEFEVPQINYFFWSSAGGKTIEFEDNEKVVTDTIFDVWSKIQSAENDKISFVQAEAEIRKLFQASVNKNDDSASNKQFYQDALAIKHEDLFKQKPMEVPLEFFNSTGFLLQDPVTIFGNTYERNTVLGWLDGNNSAINPETNVMFTRNDIISDTKLKLQIQSCIRRNPCFNSVRKRELYLGLEFKK